MNNLNLFHLNKYITLKLEDGNTIIYVNGERFKQCKYLIANKITWEELADYKTELKSIIHNISISSIDDQIEEVKIEEEFCIDIFPEEEFWAHCSNLQAWVESEYDTRLLHRNLAFPLLKKLSDVGDRKAKEIFKEEIAFRYKSGSEVVRDFLIEQKFLDYLDKAEFWNLLPSQAKIIKDFTQRLNLNLIMYPSKSTALFNSRGSPNQLGFNLKNNGIHGISLYRCKLTKNEWRWVLKRLSEIKTLSLLNLEKNNLRTVPEILGEIKNLVSLDLSKNQIEKITDSIGGLRHLEVLNVEENKLSLLPESIGNLKSLETLRASKNNLEQIPDSICNLKSLKILILNKNELSLIPDSIGDLDSLEKIFLSDNNLDSLPESIIKLQNLKFLSLRGNKIRESNEYLKIFGKKVRIIIEDD